MQFIGKDIGKVRVFHRHTIDEAQAAEPQQPEVAFPLPNQHTCIDPIQPLYELFLTAKHHQSLPSEISLVNQNILKRLADFKKGPMGHYLNWVQTIVEVLEIHLAGSGARKMGGNELLKYLYTIIGPEIESSIKAEIQDLMESHPFPCNDFDLHFYLELGDDPVSCLEGIKKKILDNLPQELVLVSKPSIKFIIDPAGNSLTYLKIELKGPTGRFDLIFEPHNQRNILFGADDLKVKISETQDAQFSSSNLYQYFVGQVFRVLQRDIPPDESIHRRLLLSMTRGFFASEELISKCFKEEAAKIDAERRDFLLEVTIKSHFPDQMGGWCYRLAHQMVWKNIPKEKLPDGHVLTETLNATLACPAVLPKAHAMMQIIAFIAVLEEHRGELSAHLRENKLKLVFPGGYTLWMAFDPVAALQELSQITKKEWQILRKILLRMPGWVPKGKVDGDYIQSVKKGFPNLLNLLPPLPNCELLQLRLQAALSSYGAPSVNFSKRAWVDSLSSDNLKISQLKEMLRKRNRHFSEEEIDWMLNLLKEGQPELCRKVADRLLRDRNLRAVDFLKIIEPHPGIDWEPICTLLKEKAPAEKIERCLSVQRLVAAGIKSVPRDLLSSLIEEVKEQNVLLRLIDELIDQESPELFQLGLKLVERFGIEEKYAAKIALRPNDLDEARLLRYVLEKKITLTEEILDRLLNAKLELKFQVKLMQLYKGADSKRRWEQVAATLTYVSGTWPSTWPHIPELGSREQILWKGVIDLIHQKELQKAENAISTLLKHKIEPPGGRVAFLTWAHSIHVGTKLSGAFGIGNRPDDLFKADPAAVCATLLCCPGTVKLKDITFANRVVEYQLNCNKDPWPLYEKLGKQRLSESVLLRWIGQASPTTICQLLPEQPRHSLLPCLKRTDIIEELSLTPALHPWIYELLSVDSPVECSVEVLARLIEHEENPRQISLIAVYGERLPKYQQIWERVVFIDPEKAITFTAIWLEQGIAEVDLIRLHMQTNRPHENIANILRCYLNRNQDLLALNLWKKLPHLQHKKHLPLAKKLFCRVEDRQLAEWVLQTAPPEKALFMRSLSLSLDRPFVVDVLCPVLLALGPFDPREPEINTLLLPHLTQEDINLKLACKLWDTSGPCPELAKKCMSKANEGAVWVLLTWNLIKDGRWDEIIWRSIFEFLTDPIKSLETIQSYREIFHSIFQNPFPGPLDPEDYWQLLRNYALSANSKEQKDHCRRLWVEAIATFTPKIREVGLLGLQNLEATEELISRLEEKGWIESDCAYIFRFLDATGRIASLPCEQESIARVEEHCKEFESILIDPKYVKFLPSEFKVVTVALTPLVTIALKGKGDKDPHAQRIVKCLHQVIGRHSNSSDIWGEFIIEVYCRILSESKIPIPDWWIEELTELFLRHDLKT